MPTVPDTTPATPAVTATVEPEHRLTEDDGELVDEDLLVEDVSIDGLCGVTSAMAIDLARAPWALNEQVTLSPGALQCACLPPRHPTARSRRPRHGSRGDGYGG
jgi:mycofactocin precursor